MGFAEELKFIHEDIEKDFFTIAHDGYKLNTPIKGVLDDEEVFVVEILPNEDYKNTTTEKQFTKVIIQKEVRKANGTTSTERQEDLILLDYLEKAEILDQYEGN